MTFNNHRPTWKGEKSERNSKSKFSLGFYAMKNIAEVTEKTELLKDREIQS